MNFYMIPPDVPEKKGLDIQTDEQQGDPIRVSFYFLRYGTLKMVHYLVVFSGMIFFDTNA